jgi:hypothetical protein
MTFATAVPVHMPVPFSVSGKAHCSPMTLRATNGHDPYVYLNDVLTRLPTHKNSRIDELLPHLWQPQQAAPVPASADFSTFSSSIH